eukprot:COSAG02_NODE_5693_length_4119_cov_2.287562_5_plen_62_part_00
MPGVNGVYKSPWDSVLFKNGVPWRPMGPLLKGKGDSFCRQSGLLLPTFGTPRPPPPPPPPC